MRHWIMFFKLLIVSALTLGVFACGSDVETAVTTSTPPTGSAKPGFLEITLRSNPSYFLTSGNVRGFYEINLCVSNIQINRNSAATATSDGWQNVPLNGALQATSIDFTKFVTQDLPLTYRGSDSPVPAGLYKKLKITFRPNKAGEIRRNYVLANTGDTIAEEFLINYPATVADGLLIPVELEVKSNATTKVGVIMDLRSLFAMADQSFTYKPVAQAMTLNQTGSIAITVGDHDYPVLVSAQRNGKIIRSMYAPAKASDGPVVLNQLPVLSGLDNTYQLVISSANYITKIIKNVPVEAGLVTQASYFAIPMEAAQTQTVYASASKSSGSEVMGVMGTELVQRLGATSSDPAVVVAYTVSAAAELIPTTLSRKIKMDFADDPPKVGDYTTPFLSFLGLSQVVRNFVIRTDPDLNSAGSLSVFCFVAGCAL